MGVAALLLLCLVVSVGVAVASAAAEREQKAKGKVAEGITPDGAMNAPPIKVVHRWHGFALTGDARKFHVLRINILRVRQVEPVVIRELMKENKSLEEIRGELIEKQKGHAPFYQGYMRFVEAHYALGNISVMTEAGDGLTINAEVVVPSQEGSESGESAGCVGNISVTVMDYEGVKIGKGKLTMNGEEYLVLLDILPAMPG